MSKRRGFSLLEILLALAILGGSLAVLSQIIGTGADSASSARDLSLARLICQAKLAETLVSGITPVPVPSTPVASPDSSSTTPFFYAVDVAPSTLDGMLAIRVSVQAQDPDGGPALASFSLTRWIIDPALGLEEAQAEYEAQQAAEADAEAGL
ncbi:MAG: prepilin-type N-terminal cleavage/methylation domain-containing protein [Planctomycetaceae bacterium]